tara:strand:+ start:3463 stop:4032 length:570 start_codon:yes stop_codon:yes gene_type:complete
MSLKTDIIKMREEVLKLSGSSEDDIAAEKTQKVIKLEAELLTKAIEKFLTSAEFRVTEFKAPVVVEQFKIPEQPCNVSISTLMAEYGPVLDTLKNLASPLGLGKIIETLESAIQKAMKPQLEGGTMLPSIDLDIKDDDALECVGYTWVGEDDPETQDSFDVTDEKGQTTNTKVKLLPADIQDLLYGDGE